MSNFMEALMEESIFSGGKNLSEEEWQILAYKNGERLIPLLNKHFPTPDKAVSALIAILGNLVLLEPDPLKRITLLNNIHNAVLGMVEVYEKGEMDGIEIETESGAEEEESSAGDLFEGSEGTEEEILSDEEYDENEDDEEYTEDKGEEYEEEGEEDVEDVEDVEEEEEAMVPEVEGESALDMAGYQPEEKEEEVEE